MGTAMAIDQALYRRTVLSNGLTVITEPMDHVRTVALGVWVAAGSRFEDVPRNGVSHFIEHILFKGTVTRSALAIAEAMDAIGGQLNAFTDKEQTCYYLRVISEHLEEGLGVMADMLLHPAIEAEALERERQVLAEEIKMYEDAPDDLVHDVFAETLWPGHPLGRPVSGTLTTLAGLRGDDLRAYMADRYRPDAVLVTAAGLLEHDQIVELVEHALGPWAGRATPSVHLPPTARRATAYRSKEIEQVHVCLGVPGLRQAHPDRYGLAVLDSALGSGMSSRLFQEIREERGLAYAISSYQMAYSDAGAFAVYAAASPLAAREVVRLTLDGLVRAREGLTADEVSRAKESLKGSLMLGLETPGSRMSKLARSEIYFGRQITLDEILADVAAVRGEDVRRLAEELLVLDRLALAAIGPFDQQPGLADAIDEEVRARADV
jgi:predicted Zn-dependent peptidase